MLPSLSDLRSDGTAHEQAVEHLHELLLRAARFEVARRRPKVVRTHASHLGALTLAA